MQPRGFLGGFRSIEAWGLFRGHRKGSSSNTFRGAFSKTTRGHSSTPERAKQAGVLRARSGVLDVVEAFVFGEAVSGLPAIILTSDLDEIKALVGAASARDRVTVILV